jgi:hypothetical protein
VTFKCQISRCYSRLGYKFESYYHQGDTCVSGLQSDLDAREQVPTATSSSLVLDSRPVQEQVLLTSVKVKCEDEVSWYALIDVIVAELWHILLFDLKSYLLYM